MSAGYDAAPVFLVAERSPAAAMRHPLPDRDPSNLDSEHIHRLIHFGRSLDLLWYIDPEEVSDDGRTADPEGKEEAQGADQDAAVEEV